MEEINYTFSKDFEERNRVLNSKDVWFGTMDRVSRMLSKYSKENNFWKSYTEHSIPKAVVFGKTYPFMFGSMELLPSVFRCGRCAYPNLVSYKSLLREIKHFDYEIRKYSDLEGIDRDDILKVFYASAPYAVTRAPYYVSATLGEDGMNKVYKKNFLEVLGCTDDFLVKSAIRDNTGNAGDISRRWNGVWKRYVDLADAAVKSDRRGLDLLEKNVFYDLIDMWDGGLHDMPAEYGYWRGSWDD